MNEDKLLPCPFCGCPETFLTEVRTDTGAIVPDAWMVGCPGCQLDVFCGDSSQDEIRDLYNARKEAS
jgi:hypothetical protein